MSGVSNGGKKPRLLDLFCGAGGATKGYQRAGFHVTGVDIVPQPNYCGDEFWQMDALGAFTWDASELWAEGFAAIHASPPCQAHVKGMAAANRALGREYDHPELIGKTRELLISTELPYVIENVIGAPLENPVQLCGSSFNLAVRRHRRFECSFPLLVPPCDHSRQNGDYWTSWRPGGQVRRAKVVQVYGQAAGRDEWGPAMGIDWMTYDELAEAIPPAFTEHIGEALMAHLKATIAA